MTAFNLGPDAMLLVYAFGVSLLVAILTWRRAAPRTAVLMVLVAAVAMAVAQNLSIGDGAGAARQIVRAAFIVVPSAVLLGASRVTWLAHRAWLFVLIGPATFVGCY